ncbi:hypothetical protein UlMin_022155 [Ulmus minor]
MDTNNALRQQFATIRRSLFDDGILHECYKSLEEWAESENSIFDQELMNMHISYTAETIPIIEQLIEQVNFDLNKLQGILQRLQGSSNGVGANKVTKTTKLMREFVKEGDLERIITAFQQLKKEHSTLQSRIEPYYQLRASENARPSECKD